MKSRTGFISNSSSSSFVIAIKSEPCLACGRGSALEDWIKSLPAEAGYSDDTQRLDLQELMSENTYYDDWESKRLENIKKYLANPQYNIYYIRVCYHDEISQAFIERTQAGLYPEAVLVEDED